MKSFSIVTLGCPKNEIDSEILASELERAGWKYSKDLLGASVVIVNTCAFVEDAKTESIESIYEILKAREKGGRRPRILVAGCLPQRYGRELFRLMPEADGFLGSPAPGRVIRAAEEALAGRRSIRVDEPDGSEYIDLGRSKLESKFYGYMRLSEGCRNDCSYCVIPRIRGPLTSRSVEALLVEAEALAGRGVKELVLVGQDTTAYGVDRGERGALVGLLKSLERVSGIEWIRLLYTHPLGWDEELMNYIDQSEKVCRYVDVPFQHVSDRILRMMNRLYGKKLVEDLVETLRKRIAEVSLRSSFIVGFPGETEREFGELVRFVEDFELDHVGVFKYSREEGTRAAGMASQKSAAVKERRWQELMEAQLEVVRRKAKAMVGEVRPVLIEEASCGEERAVGRLAAQAPEVDGVTYVERAPAPGVVAPCVITGFDDYDFTAEVAGSALLPD